MIEVGFTPWNCHQNVTLQEGQVLGYIPIIPEEEIHPLRRGTYDLSCFMFEKLNLTSHFEVRLHKLHIVLEQRSPLGTGDSGVSRHVADATGTSFLSSWRSVSISQDLLSPPPSISTTVKSTTKPT